MKCPRQISMPSGVQLWLEEQLESRGIDAEIYSKYIFSKLYNDSSDFSIKPQDCETKTLIDELCAKLKGFKEKGQYLPTDSPKPRSFEVSQPLSLQDKAFRYYTAFPPLTPKLKSDHIHSSLGSSSNVWSGKRVFGSSVGKNRTFSEGNNRDSKSSILNWLDENKENNGCNKDVREKVRSRSTVKQQTPEKTSRNMAKSLDRKDNSNRSEMSKSRRLYQPSNELENEPNLSLWTAEKSFDDLTGCDQDLPMDFQQLLESPEATKMSLDFSRCVEIKHTPSFIQCGTNITSSIWSEKAEDTMECSMVNESGSDINMSLNFNKSVWNVMADVPQEKRSEMLDPSKESQVKSNLWSVGDSCGGFNMNSWKAIGNVDSKEPVSNFGKWSDVEGTSLLLDDSNNFFSSIGSTLHSSLTTLNHNKEDSSFTEVIPKMQSLSSSASKEVVNAEPFVSLSESDTSKNEEEDLLTSMKTHFRPIKQDTIEIVRSTAAPLFPDGTTFPISNRLDEPNFHRSPGGGLYLDSDINHKYMEFNEFEFGTPSEFIPKFRLLPVKNEKFCQTDETVMPSHNYVESDCEELYFPDDEKLVRDMVEEDEAEEEENVFWGGETCIKVDGWMATWPTSGIWSNEPNVQQIWCGGNMWKTGSDSVESMKPEGNGGEEGDQYTQLRNEWTQEAEELLSDISQHLCLSNYMDTQPAKTTLVESAWGKLSSASFSRTLPLTTPYSLMQS